MKSIELRHNPWAAFTVALLVLDFSFYATVDRVNNTGQGALIRT
jgi:hypothetical protein